MLVKEATGLTVTWHGIPDSKVHGAYMGTIWGWKDPGGPHVSPMNLAIWDGFLVILTRAIQMV